MDNKHMARCAFCEKNKHHLNGRIGSETTREDGTAQESWKEAQGRFKMQC